MAQESLTKLIRAEAQKQGVDPDLAVKIATVESGLDPQAKNPRSTAAGLFQLLAGTTKQLGGDPKKRFDPLENARLGVQLIKQNKGQLMTALGREPLPHELYAAHMFGPTGAVKLIQASPKMPIQKAVSQFQSQRMADRIVRDNRLSGTVGDVMTGFEQQFGVKQPAQQKPEAAKKPEPAKPAKRFSIDDLSSVIRGFADGGDVSEELVAPPVEVVEKRPSGMMKDLKRKEFTEPLQTDSRSMLDRLLAGRKTMTEDLGGIGADIAAGTLNPIYGVASSAADFELARREGDKLGMALSGVGMVPVAGPLLKGLGMAAIPMAGIVKQKGGNWLSMAKDFQSSTEPGVRDVSGQLAGLKSPTIVGQTPAERIPMVEELLRNDPDLNPELQVRVQRNLDQLKRDAALDKWVDSNLTNYFKKQMATPDDPLRALAEEGRIPLDPEDIAETRRLREKMKQYTPESFLEPIFDVRNREAMAETEPGRVFETFTDSLIKGDSAGDLLRRAEGSSRYAQKIVQDNPWLTKVDPSTEVYSLRDTPASVFSQTDFDGMTGPLLTQSFQLQHLTDVLRTDMAEGRLSPERLSKMSVADAYKRMFEFDDEMVKAAKKAELERTAALMKSEPVLQYETGFRWVKLPDPESDEASMRLVKDIGCRGGWCTRYDENALRYGAASRGNELFVLLDESGKAHIQIQTQKVPFDDFEQQRATNQYIDILNQDPGRLTNFVNEYWNRINAPREAGREISFEDFSRVFRNVLDNDTQKLVNEFINEGKPIPENIRLPRDFVNFLVERKQTLDSVRDIRQMKPWNNTWEGQFVRDELAKNPQYKEQIRPYIDDFVANGNWREVQDLSNSGLVGSPGTFASKEALVKAYEDVSGGMPVDTEFTGDLVGSLKRTYLNAKQVTPEMVEANPALQSYIDFATRVDELTQSLRPPRKMADGGEVEDTWCLSFLCRKR
jgi:hypothetical protein